MTLCATCGEEVRFGHRSGQAGWWHRLDVDHHAILGQPFTAEMAAEVERQLDLPRTRLAPGVSAKCPTYQRLWPEEVYTTREHDLVRYRKKKSFREAEAREAAENDEEELVFELPPVETPCHPIDPTEFAPRSGIRQIVNLVLKQGWELRRLTHSRGPYVGASGELLSISDTIVLAARTQILDGSCPVAVALWRDGKFDFAFIGTIRNGHLSPRKVNATEMKDWIKDPMTTETAQ